MKKKRIVQLLALLAIFLVLIVLFLVKRAGVAAESDVPVIQEVMTDDAVTVVDGSTVLEEVVTTGPSTSTTAGHVAVEEVVVADEQALFVDEIDLEALSADGLPVMIQFYSTNCGPCQSMMDDLKSFHASSQGMARVVAVNVDEHPEVGLEFPVIVVPTQLFLTSSGEVYKPSQRIMASIGGFVRFTYADTGEDAYIVHQGVLSESQMRRICEDAGRL